MDAGKLDRRVTIETPATTRGETGGHEETWSTFATLWANVRDPADSRVSKVVTIRYRADITAAMRVRFADGTTARISHLRELGRHEWLEVYCEAING